MEKYATNNTFCVDCIVYLFLLIPKYNAQYTLSIVTNNLVFVILHFIGKHCIVRITSNYKKSMKGELPQNLFLTLPLSLNGKEQKQKEQKHTNKHTHTHHIKTTTNHNSNAQNVTTAMSHRSIL